MLPRSEDVFFEKGFGVSRKFLMIVLAVALLAAACGGGDDGADATTTTVEQDEAPTTTEAATTTEPDDGGGPTADIGDIPRECVDAFVDYLRAIEPTVEGVDWETANLDAFEEVADELAEVTTDYEEAAVQSQCDDIAVDATDEESFEFLLQIARDEAPGTVGYFEMIKDLALGVGGSSDGATGDCEADIAAIQAIIDEHGSMEHLGVADITTVGSLMTSITANCSMERAAEFFEQDDVSAFMEG